MDNSDLDLTKNGTTLDEILGASGVGLAFCLGLWDGAFYSSPFISDTEAYVACAAAALGAGAAIVDLAKSRSFSATQGAYLLLPLASYCVGVAMSNN